MATKKYPIGTKIRFIGDSKRKPNEFMYEDDGLTGKIVGIEQGYPLIFLPESEYISVFSTKKRPATVQCDWYQIEPLVVKGEQLLFSFMEQVDDE